MQNAAEERSQALNFRTRMSQAQERLDYECAEQAALDWIRQDPDNPDPWQYLGGIRLCSRNWQGAIEAYETYLRMLPANAGCNWGLMSVQENLYLARERQQRPPLELYVGTTAEGLIGGTVLGPRFNCGGPLSFLIDLHCWAPELRVAPVGGKWTDFLTLGLHRITDAGQTLPIPLEWRSRLPHDSLRTRDLSRSFPGHVLALSCRMDGMFTASLLPGVYQLSGVFDTTSVTDPAVYRCRCEAEPFKFIMESPHDTNGGNREMRPCDNPS